MVHTRWLPCPLFTRNEMFSRQQKQCLLFCAIFFNVAPAEGYYSWPTHVASPYIFNTTFRSIANFILDDPPNTFTPFQNKPADIIFVRPEALRFFFNSFHPHMPHKYILITHWTDVNLTGEYKH